MKQEKRPNSETQSLPSPFEHGNTWTHLIGVVFALSCIWLIWPAVAQGWQMAMGVIFFICGMFLMFLSSTVYHMLPQGRIKRALRKCDHISIYVMIACSYTPICIGVVGGWLGWTVFAIQWLFVILGVVYKLAAMGRWPRLSLGLYLFMGWSGVFIAPSVYTRLTPLAIAGLLAEGLFYTAGTYFFAHDSRRHYHAIWHIFVLLGAMAHFMTVLCIVIGM